MTYEEYMELIPQEMKQTINQIIRNLYLYTIQEKKIKISGETLSQNECIFYSFLLGVSWESKINSYLTNNGVKLDKIKHEDDYYATVNLEEKKQIFDKYKEWFTCYSSTSLYSEINAYSILRKALEELNSYKSSIGIDSYLKTNVEAKEKEEREKNIQTFESNIGNILNIQTYEYLKLASKVAEEIRDLFKRGCITDNDSIKNNEKYIIPYSLLIAIFISKDKEIKKIAEYFSKKGLNRDKLYNNLSESSINNNDIIYTDISVYYLNYLKNLPDKEISDATIYDILERLFNKKFIDINSIEKILYENNLDIKDFKNIQKRITLMNEEKFEAEYNEFCYKLKRETIEFTDLSAKIFELERKKINMDNHPFIHSEDDLDTFAVYIASHYYNTDFEKFFSENNVTYEKVMNLLGITITNEEIKNSKVNKQLVLSRFKRFINDGVNKNKNIETITPNNICYNLCSDKFNKSDIIEKIFESIRTDFDYPKDSFELIKRYLEEKEATRISEKEETFFSDKMPIYNYLKLINYYYNDLSKSNLKYNLNKEELITFATLYASLEISEDVKIIYEELGIPQTKISKFLGYSEKSHNIETEKMNIDLIVDIIFPYLSTDLSNFSIDEIAKNIITSKRKTNFNLKKFLYNEGLSYESFDDFTIYNERVANRKKEQEFEQKYKECFESKMASSSHSVFKYATSYLEELKKESSEYNKEELKDIAILLAVLRENETVSTKFLKKYNITTNKILNIQHSKIEASKDKQKIYANFNDFASNLIEEGNYIYPNNILIKLLSSNSKKVKELLAKNNCDINRLLQECKYGKNYEETLTIEEVMAEVEKLNDDLAYTNYEEIINYCNDLDTYQSILMNSNGKIQEAYNEVNRKLNNHLDNLYTSKKKGLIIRKEEKTINQSEVNNFSRNITTYTQEMENICKELRNVIRYHYKIIDKLEKRSKILEKGITYYEQKQQEPSESNLENFDYTSLKSALTSKKQLLATKIQNLKKLAANCENILNNYEIFCYALQFVKNVEIPSLQSYLIINKGYAVKNKTLLYIQQVQKLFKEGITPMDNSVIEETANNIRYLVDLKDTSPEEDFQKLTSPKTLRLTKK